MAHVPRAVRPLRAARTATRVAAGGSLPVMAQLPRPPHEVKALRGVTSGTVGSAGADFGSGVGAGAATGDGAGGSAAPVPVPLREMVPGAA